MLEELRANSENACANNESQMQGSPTTGIQYPIETGCKKEESKEMEDFVVYNSIDL